MWAEKFKLNKQLVRSITQAGFDNPKEIQLKTLSRIIGGQDVVAVGPEGCGKTTTYIIGALNRFTYQADGVPHVLILVPDAEKVQTVIEQFALINRNSTIRIVGLHANAGIDQQMDDLADGADIVVAVPDRARAIYLKLGLNLNKIELFVVDDAQAIVKQGLQLPVNELANSIVKAQRLVFSEVMHDRLQKMITPFMQNPAVVEVEEAAGAQVAMYPQMLYHVPNFGTKLNLLNLFVNDDEVFTKMVVFVNTKQTAETVYKNFIKRTRSAAATLGSVNFEYASVNSIEDFKAADELRVLVVANETTTDVDLQGIPFIMHLDLPADNELYISRLIDNGNEDTLALTFATDLELDQVRKIEQATGQKMQRAELPEDLLIEKDRKQKEAEKPKPQSKPDPNKYVPGEAFHQKKPENAKTFNFSSGEKAKMNKKKKH
jgi:superfamily II DNA/RNA helicase